MAGVTGTGKTVTLQVMAQGFSDAGVPVFCADMKGDLAGIAMAGEPKPFLTEPAEKIGLENYEMEGAPVIFWDLFGKRGHPMRATIAEMGPVLLSRLLDLNDTQAGVLNIAFKYADDEGLLLLDFKDFRRFWRTLCIIAPISQSFTGRWRRPLWALSSASFWFCSRRGQSISSPNRRFKMPI